MIDKDGADRVPALNRWLRNTFRGGVLLSFSLMLVGLALHFLAGGAFTLSAADRAIPWSELPTALAAGQPLAFLSAGVILLLATPVAGLLACVVALVRQKEAAMAAVTVAVLAILAVSAVMAK